MSRKSDVATLRKSREFIDYAKRNDCEIIRGKGSHVKARNEKGFAIIPDTPAIYPPAHDAPSSSRLWRWVLLCLQ